jgi:hypothetical protein
MYRRQVDLEWIKTDIVKPVGTKGVKICLFFCRGQKVSKNSKHWSNEKGPSSTRNIVQRNNSGRSNATSQCIWIQIFNLQKSA